MKQKIKAHAQKHRLFYSISLTVILTVICGVILNFIALYSKSKTFYTANLERQSLTNLGIYHSSTRALVKVYFDQSIGTVNNLSKDSAWQTAVVARNTDAVKTALTQQRAIDGLFNTLVVFGVNGKSIAIDTDVTSPPASSATVSTTLPDAFIAGSKADGVVIIPAHHTVYDRDVITLTAPIKNKQGALLGVLSGTITLNALADKLHLSSNLDPNLSSILVDDKDNLIINSDSAASPIQNLSDKEPFLTSLKQTDNPPATQEYNFQQKKVFADGSKISLGNTGSLSLISFYNVAGYRQQVNALTANVSNIFSGFIIRDAVFLIFGLGTVGLIIHVHEDKKR